MSSLQKMQTYAEFETRQRQLMEEMKKHDLECVSCPECDSQFFEQVEVMMVKADHNLILGQDIPAKPGAETYKFLRCIYCKNLLEPRILANTRDVLGSDYDQLLDTLEGKRDKRPKTTAVVKDEIQAEEL